MASRYRVVKHVDHTDNVGLLVYPKDTYIFASIPLRDFLTQVTILQAQLLMKYHNVSCGSKRVCWTCSYDCNITMNCAAYRTRLYLSKGLQSPRHLLKGGIGTSRQNPNLFQMLLNPSQSNLPTLNSHLHSSTRFSVGV